MIKVRNLSKSFNGKAILKGIDLDIAECENLLILGPSGQGKTVLIKSLARLITPDSGSVEYDGEDIFKMPRRKFSKLQNSIAFVFQANALFDFMNVKDNLSLFIRTQRKDTEEQIQEQVESAIDFVGLGKSVLDKFPEELSGGMGKRVAIARAFLKDPRIIFYDEPTDGLDEGNKRKVIDLIRRLKDKVCATSVIVTHDIQLMKGISDRVVLLKEGRIAFFGTKEEVSQDILDKLYEAGGEDE